MLTYAFVLVDLPILPWGENDTFVFLALEISREKRMLYRRAVITLITVAKMFFSFLIFGPNETIQHY